MRHKWKIAWLVVWGVPCALLILFSVLNVNRRDRVTWHFSRSHAIQISAEPGCVAAALLTEQSTVALKPLLETTRFYNTTKPALAVGRVSGPNFEGALIPNWFSILVLAMLAAVPWITWQFSLRTLLTATTLTALVLTLLVKGLG